jgi:hypothetical protein
MTKRRALSRYASAEDFTVTFTDGTDPADDTGFLDGTTGTTGTSMTQVCCAGLGLERTDG